MPIQWEPLTTWAIKFGISLCGGAAVFAGFWVLSIIVGLVFRRIEEKVALHKKQIFRFLAQIARIGVLTFGVITAIGTMVKIFAFRDDDPFLQAFSTR